MPTYRKVEADDPRVVEIVGSEQGAKDILEHNPGGMFVIKQTPGRAEVLSFKTAKQILEELGK